MPGESFTLNSDDIETTRYILGPPVTKDRPNTSKTRSLNGRTRLCLTPFVTRVTPGTVNVRISDATQR